MEVAIEDFLGNSSMTADLSNVFNNLIGHRFVFPDYGDRRASFMDNIRSYSNAHTGIRVFYPDGVNSIMNISYFLVYSFLAMLNRYRGGFLHDDLIRQNVMLVLNECANNNFDLLYELIFD